MSSQIEREVKRNTADWSKAGGDRVTVQRNFPVGTPAAPVRTGFGWPSGVDEVGLKGRGPARMKEI